MKDKLVLSALIVILLSACSRTGRPEAGAIGGAAVGGGVGAAIGSQSNHVGPGAVAGAGIGAVAGGVIGNALDKQEENEQERDVLLLRQEYELQRQQRELEDLRRQRYHDNQLRRYLRTHGQEPEPQSEISDYRPSIRESGDNSDGERLY